MSANDHGAPGAGHGVRTEDDRIDSRPVLLVGVGSLVLFFLASMAAVAFLKLRQGEHPPLPIPQEIGQSKIGMVEQTQFELALRGVNDAAARRERLSAYGWSDRQAGLAHIPIERAMELVRQGVRAPSQRPPPPAPGAQP
jgi:hypothetical protein